MKENFLNASTEDFIFSAANPEDDFVVEDPSLALETPKTEAPSASDAASKKESEDKPEPEFSEEELLRVFDEILFEGSYAESVTIRNKLKVVFRSRSGKETADVARRIDKAELNLMSTVGQYISMFNLAYSLVSYNDRDLSGLPVFPEKQGSSRFEFISSLPAPIIAALSQALVKFDRKVFLACQEAERNF